MNKNDKIYIAGHNGLVGSAIHRNLLAKGYTNFVFTSFSEYDLRNQAVVEDFFCKEKPQYVFFAAAKVGGIVANNLYRAEFIYDNLQIQNNIIHFAWKYGVTKLLFLGSSCIYPKHAPQPMNEDHLLTNVLEYTNEPYAIAKIAGIKMCESYNLQYGTNFISVMPTNLYGPNDNFDLEKSHVLPALIRKMHLGKLLMNQNTEALRKDLNKLPIKAVNGSATVKEITEVLAGYGITETGVTLWGTGTPKREFLHSNDLADACVFVMENRDFSHLMALSENPNGEIRNTHINIGVGHDVSIKELAETVQEIVGYNGKLIWDTEKPDGTPRKLLDVSKLHALGWKAQTPFRKGITEVYKNYTQWV